MCSFVWKVQVTRTCHLKWTCTRDMLCLLPFLKLSMNRRNSSLFLLTCHLFWATVVLTPKYSCLLIFPEIGSIMHLVLGWEMKHIFESSISCLLDCQWWLSMMIMLALLSNFAENCWDILRVSSGRCKLNISWWTIGPISVRWFGGDEGRNHSKSSIINCDSHECMSSYALSVLETFLDLIYIIMSGRYFNPSGIRV